MPEIRAAGASIWYESEGPSDAPALLLSNALGTSIGLWDSNLAAWTPRFRTIRYDSRGHGRSTVAPGPYTLDTLGQDALAVLDAAGVRRANVCGVSLGGLVGMWLALNASERIGRLVLANTGARIGTTESWAARIGAVEIHGMHAVADGILERWFTPRFRRVHREDVAPIRSMLESCVPAGYASCCAAIRDADLRQSVRRIVAATLVVVGTYDTSTPPASGELLKASIPGARLERLDAAHLSNVEQSDAFSRIVLEFIGS